MKKLLSVVVALFAISTMVANVTIQTNFDGIVLGESSRSEVNNILLSKGMQFDSESSQVDSALINDCYLGELVCEGVTYDKVLCQYYHDTLVSQWFIKYNELTELESLSIEAIYSKYDQLSNADKLFYTSSVKGNDTDAIMWSRTDGKSTIITKTTPTYFVCVFFAEQRFYEIATNIIQSGPDYAEENKVYGVGGVKFGDSRENVKRVILSKSSELLEEDAYSMLFTDVKIGGVIYDFARFYFLPNQGLVSVNLQSAFYEWREEEALMKFESVKGQYERKYTNLTLLADDEDLKGYQCGAYIDGYDYLPILISFQKSLSKGGDIMYYVQVDYYNHRTDNLYNDEI